MRRQLVVFLTSALFSIAGCAAHKPAPSAPQGDPAAPVNAPDTEKIVADTIALAAVQDPRSLDHFAEVVLLGAGMWDVMTGMERACCHDDNLYDVGTRAFIVLPEDPGRGWRARAYTGDDRRLLVKLKPFQTLMTAFARAEVRPATAVERRFFWSVHHADITGKPLTVIQGERNARLVVWVSDGKLAIVDALVGYDLNDRVDVSSDVKQADAGH